MLCVPVLVDNFDCPLGRQDRAFLPSADMAEGLTCEKWAVGLVALHHSYRHDSEVVAARDART